MGNGMNKVIPGVYVGNIRDSKDKKQLEANHITHILSIHTNASKIHQDKVYLCINADDNANQNLSQYFPICNEFIHNARLCGGSVLIHCLAGVSRSVTVTVAYIMSVTDLGWRDALNSVRGARKCANPNFGFQRQLLNFEHEQMKQERARMKGKFKPSPYEDEAECQRLLAEHQRWVLYGDEASENTDTYPLPHKAYGERESAKSTDSAAAEGDASESKPVVTSETTENVESKPDVCPNVETMQLSECPTSSVQKDECLNEGEKENGTVELEVLGDKTQEPCTPNGNVEDVAHKVDEMFAC